MSQQQSIVNASLGAISGNGTTYNGVPYNGVPPSVVLNTGINTASPARFQYTPQFPRDLRMHGQYGDPGQSGEWILYGSRVERNDAFRPGLVVLVPGVDGHWIASELTMATLVDLGANHVTAWTRAMDLLHEALQEGQRTMKTVMVDLSSVAAFHKPKSKPVGRTRDRVDSVCVSIAGLVAEMAPFCDGSRKLPDAQMQSFAVKYGKLRDEMRKLREAMDHADGMFEVAQMQIVALMDEDEVTA